jgi:hypothetical protein
VRRATKPTRFDWGTRRVPPRKKAVSGNDDARSYDNRRDAAQLVAPAGKDSRLRIDKNARRIWRFIDLDAVVAALDPA